MDVSFGPHLKVCEYRFHDRHQSASWHPVPLYGGDNGAHQHRNRTTCLVRFGHVLIAVFLSSQPQTRIVGYITANAPLEEQIALFPVSTQWQEQ